MRKQDIQNQEIGEGKGGSGLTTEQVATKSGNSGEFHKGIIYGIYIESIH